MSEFATTFFYWVGIITCGVGSAGVICMLAIWSINKVADLLGFTEALIRAYGQYLQNQRDAGCTSSPRNAIRKRKAGG